MCPAPALRFAVVIDIVRAAQQDIDVLCLQQIHERDNHSRPRLHSRASADRTRLRQKIGPLWKLMYVIEPLPQPTSAMILRDEKNELLVLDGPFAETKA
jgi:hypothetical protein